MTNKATVVLPVFYPETAELIERHAELNGIKIGDARGMPLFCDIRGRQAGGNTLARIVNEVCTSLGLRTYYQATPSCHDLRRTFATCNMRPLGFGMDIQEIAERLRIGINIAHQHYVVQNPLIQEARAKIHREKMPKDADAAAIKLVQQIEALAPKDAGFLESYKKVLTNRLAARREVGITGHVAEWLSEKKAMANLHKAWTHVPRARCLRRYFAIRHAWKRIGKHGPAHYDAAAVRNLVEQYEPIADHVAVLSREIRQLVLLFEPLVIGQVKLIKRAKIGEFFKAMKNGNGDPALAKTGTT